MGGAIDPRLAVDFLVLDDLFLPVVVLLEDGTLILCFEFAVIVAIFFVKNLLKSWYESLIIMPQYRY
jgi:hypothetical protein